MKNNKGITLIALAVTVIVLLILAGVSINSGITDIGDSSESKDEIEARMVYNAICQRYTKASLTGETLPGQNIGIEAEINSFKTATAEEIITEDLEDYYKLEESSLLELGIEQEKDTYIVNYKEGKVFNLTKYKEDNIKIYIDTE